MAQGFAPAAVIEPPPRVPYPYGVFSVVPMAEHVTENWLNGVQWEALACDNTTWAVGECDSPTNWPTTWPTNPGLATASAFTAIGLYKCSPNSIQEDADKKARAILEAREQYIVEKRLWEALALNVTTVVGADYVAIVGELEKFIADSYGAQGVIHAGRRAAVTLAQQNFLTTDKGGQLRTVLGTPVIAGGGYPGTGARTTEVQQIAKTGTPTAGTFTITLPGYGTTTALQWNDTAANVAAALNALDTTGGGVSGITATGGPLNTTAVNVTFGSEGFVGTDVPQMTITNTITGGSYAVTTTTAGGDPAPTAGHSWVMGSPAIFGYRSPEIYNFSNRPGDLIDRGLNNSYGMAARDYLFGWEPCGVAIADLILGAEAGV